MADKNNEANAPKEEKKVVKKEYYVLKRFTTDKVNEFGGKVLLDPNAESTKDLLNTKHIR